MAYCKTWKRCMLFKFFLCVEFVLYEFSHILFKCAVDIFHNLHSSVLYYRKWHVIVMHRHQEVKMYLLITRERMRR